MVEYQINDRSKTCRYNPYTDTVYLGSIDTSIFTDNELSEYVADSLIHEFIHSLLDKTFNSTTSKLFDVIQHHFRNTELQDKLFGVGETAQRETYQVFIKREGFKAFLEYYHIDTIAFNQASIIANKRLK